ncbi:MAG: isoprenyl transferase [Pseudomonadota bacterium]
MTTSSDISGTPRHVAIIMDGNGRWATRRGMPRIAGHKRGVERVRDIVEAAGNLGVETLTLYAFSTENWKRPVVEVAGLMRLFRLYMRKESNELTKRGARVRFIGDPVALPADIQGLMKDLEARTAENSEITLQVALNYGGRDELVRAAKRIAADAVAGKIDANALDQSDFAAYLDTAGMADPDLVIRTSGEYRTSNFLPWQSAYSEFAFVEECWPDFTPALLERVLRSYDQRDRRFGAVAR